MQGNLIILEEAAYCDQGELSPPASRLAVSVSAYAGERCRSGLVAEVIVPLLSMQESVLLCISTLLDGSNHYSKMFELMGDDGEPLFKQIAITLG